MQFANWNIGRIVNVYPGQDGKARNVRVKTSTGVHDRPVTKIAKNVLIKLECVSLNIHIIVINNGNCTEWSAIWAEIIRVISKSNERAVRVSFEITSMISDQNCTTRGSITTLLHPFWNRPNTGLGQFKYFIDAVLSRSEIKFIHFLGGKSKSFGNKSCKICHMILFVFHFPAIWSVTLNKP